MRDFNIMRSDIPNNMSSIMHRLLAIRPVPVATAIISICAISRSVMDEDFVPAVLRAPHASIFYGDHSGSKHGLCVWFKMESFRHLGKLFQGEV